MLLAVYQGGYLPVARRGSPYKYRAYVVDLQYLFMRLVTHRLLRTETRKRTSSTIGVYAEGACLHLISEKLAAAVRTVSQLSFSH